MSSVYPRGKVLWVAFVDATGLRRCVSTGLRLGDTPVERERALLRAEAVAKELERQAAVARAAAQEGPLTLLRYVPQWIAARRRRGVRTASGDEASLRDHVLPTLGPRLVAEVRPPEIRALFRELTDSGKLAPHTIHNIYGTLHCLFADAVAEEIRDANPCILRVKRRELPEKVDADPTWRPRAVYSPAEAKQLCTDERIQEWRRALYALLFLAGLRIGEALQRRVRDYEAAVEPLGKLVVATAWNSKYRMETGTKTRRPREVPVHPELARVLAAWLLSGWSRLMDRPPGPEDLLFPVRGREEVRPRSSKSLLRALERDCRRLGLRERRVHDTRRSFISWCRGAGANDALLRWVTHGPRRTVLDDYTTPPWPDLCRQVLVLRIDLHPGVVVPVVARQPTR